MSFIIDKLRKIFPPSIHSFNLEMDRVLRAIEEERQSIVRNNGKNRCTPVNTRDTAIFSFTNCQRRAENQTTLEIERCLKRYSIPYKRGRYVGQKEFVLILSKNLEFITSM